MRCNTGFSGINRMQAACGFKKFLRTVASTATYPTAKQNKTHKQKRNRKKYSAIGIYFWIAFFIYSFLASRGPKLQSIENSNIKILCPLGTRAETEKFSITLASRQHSSARRSDFAAKLLFSWLVLVDSFFLLFYLFSRHGKNLFTSQR